jgi:MFS family permease
VTFWDAGELIASMHNLGIPHPPGTPLFVLLGHVWAALLPVGEYAWRTNLMSATFSALAAAGFFLVAHETLRRATPELAPGPRRVVAVGGGMAAGLLSGFTFTHWQNSNETEVYSVATFTIALICWLCLRWRAARGTDRSLRLILLILYLAGLSMGNHLLALLAGPAVVMFLGATLLGSPAASPAVRRQEWATLAVVAGLWALLIGTGLGSTPLIIVGGLCFAAAAALAAMAGMLPFALLSFAVAAIGVTTYLFLYIRAGQAPTPNEADPSTWDHLLAVIRRAQYPVRTPLDDPTVRHGPDNPGRSLSIIWLQLQNYIQYFNWQWARGLAGRGLGVLDGQLAGALLAAALGLRGLFAQRRADREGWWLLFTLFLVTGLGLVAYMNFKPGASIGYDLFPEVGQHEVRERDYFFVVSFLVWGVWAGIGLATLVRDGLQRVPSGALRAAAPLVFLIAFLPAAANVGAASRRHGADARLAGDFSYNLLNSMPPYGVLFTYGDNDTFPLWWAQEVEGVRRDVTVVCLALANTEWYARQLRDNPVQPFDEATAPPVWRGRAPIRPEGPTLRMTDEEIASAYSRQLGEAVTVNFGPFRQTYPAGAVFYTSDFVTVRILQQNLGRRPVAWSLTTGRNFLSLDPYLLQQGLVFLVQTAPPDSTAPGLDRQRLAGALLDVPTTTRLVWETFRYGGLRTRSGGAMDVTSRSFASTLSLPPAQLAYAYQTLGDEPMTIRNLELAGSLAPNAAIAAALSQIRLRRFLPGPDSP